MQTGSNSDKCDFCMTVVKLVSKRLTCKSKLMMLADDSSSRLPTDQKKLAFKLGHLLNIKTENTSG